MDEERFWSLVSLKLSGEASPEELAEMETLLRTHPEWGLRLQLYTNLWQTKPAPSPAAQTSFNRHLQRLSNNQDTPTLQFEKPTGRRIRPAVLAIAAAVLIITAGIWLLKPRSTSDGYNTVTTRPGSRSRIQLPDGTTVWLNGDSRLTYKLTGREREVNLTGEAYFDVAKDKDHPFRVHTNTVDILVLGTSFNVRSYGNDRNTETSLFQGSVEVTLRISPDKKIILKPDEKLIVHNNETRVSGIKTKMATAPDDDADQPLMTLGKVHYQPTESGYTEMLWTKNQLAFDNQTLEEVGLQLEHWFGAHVTITDERIRKLRFSGTFGDESLTRVLDALQITGNIHYTIRKKEVIITP